VKKLDFSSPVLPVVNVSRTHPYIDGCHSERWAAAGTATMARVTTLANIVLGFRR
jgi:hypothetical protein